MRAKAAPLQALGTNTPRQLAYRFEDEHEHEKILAGLIDVQPQLHKGFDLSLAERSQRQKNLTQSRKAPKVRRFRSRNSRKSSQRSQKKRNYEMLLGVFESVSIAKS
jgi:hypothetical protein